MAVRLIPATVKHRLREMQGGIRLEAPEAAEFRSRGSGSPIRVGQNMQCCRDG